MGMAPRWPDCTSVERGRKGQVGKVATKAHKVAKADQEWREAGAVTCKYRCCFLARRAGRWARSGQGLWLLARRKLSPPLSTRGLDLQERARSRMKTKRSGPTKLGTSGGSIVAQRHQGYAAVIDLIEGDEEGARSTLR